MLLLRWTPIAPSSAWHPLTVRVFAAARVSYDESRSHKPGRATAGMLRPRVRDQSRHRHGFFSLSRPYPVRRLRCAGSRLIRFRAAIARSRRLRIKSIEHHELSSSSLPGPGEGIECHNVMGGEGAGWSSNLFFLRTRTVPELRSRPWSPPC